MIRIGAPLAHVWMKDATGHAGGAGAAAVSVYTAMLGVYALARLFPADSLLSIIGLVMIALGAAYAVIENDLRRAGAYALTAHVGLSVALIGVGSPVALAGAAAHAFTVMLGFALLQMAFASVALRRGGALASNLAGLARAMPVTSVLFLIGGLNVAGVPGLAMYASAAVAIETSAAWEQRWLWLAIAGLNAACMIAFVTRPSLSMFRVSADYKRVHEAPFSAWLASALAAFFCITVGLAPAWLYQLTPPTPLVFDPFAADMLGPQLELLGSAAALSAALTLIALAPRRLPTHVRDIDLLYRGPAAALGRWAGSVLLRIHAAARATAATTTERLAHTLSQWSRSCDRPYAEHWGAAGQFAVIGAVLLIILVLRF
jgi:multicomponent Na+:H+ antiporter subunit D